jgi:hypothetical protein
MDVAQHEDMLLLLCIVIEHAGLGLVEGVARKNMALQGTVHGAIDRW